MDPLWGHVTIKMSGHPPFGAQVILNGHEYVARAAQVAGIAFTKEGNCFTAVADPQALAQVADTLSQDATVGRLSQVCDRWIYTACLCFGLDTDEQARSGFRYNYSVYQVEYSRNLIFRSGAQMDRVFNTVRRPDPVPPGRAGPAHPVRREDTAPRQRNSPTATELAVVIETPRYDLTLFKVHFGRLTLKGYTKGERVLRFEAIVHNTKELGCGRALDKFPAIVARLAAMVDRFCTTLDCVDIGFIPDATLDELPTALPDRRHPGRRRRPEQATHPHRPRRGTRPVRRTRRVHRRRPGRQGPRHHRRHTAYTTRQAAYDLRKLRGKHLVRKPGRSRRYQVPANRPHHRRPAHPPRPDHRPHPRRSPQPPKGRKPAHWTTVDRDYEALRIHMQTLFHDLGITTDTLAA